jgi:D-cysteine desulfhydrase
VKQLLSSWPTPLEPAPRLAERIGLRPDDLWIKRDDLTGLGGGGNKVRKLEHTVAAALDDGATTLITSGAAQSNHARLTAAAARRVGLDAVLVLRGDHAAVSGGNISLDRLLGARLVWAGDEPLDVVAARVADELTAAGQRPALIPFGGTSVVGARGYVDCALELREQAPDLVHVVVAVGSGGTMAGLVAELGAHTVLGVDTGAMPDPGARITELVERLRPGSGELRLRSDQVGPGYGVLTAAARTALEDAARTEGLVLDPVYTAKALAGLTAAVAEGEIRPGERTVFVHTGGLPGLFGHAIAAELASF